jgi:hypothetical protein
MNSAGKSNKKQTMPKKAGRGRWWTKKLKWLKKKSKNTR